MARLSFQDLSFKSEKNHIKVFFLGIFSFSISKKDLLKIGSFSLEKKSICFSHLTEEKARRKFYRLLERGFQSLKNTLNSKKTIYIHKNSNIPLIGNISFGLIDRGTNIIEVKPITSCNFKCIYCSVDEDKRQVDFVVEKDYLAQEFQKLANFKNVNNIEAHIASQGEPLLYSPLADLVRDLSKIKEVKTISVDTNGTLLTKGKVDELIKAGLTRFNLSINALDDKLAGKIAGTPCNMEKIKEICQDISKKASLIITPVLIPGLNEKEIPKIIQFAKELNADIGIQNFLPYRFGRNPVKPIDFEKFYGLLRDWEEKYEIKLIKTEKDFNIIKTKPLPKPFRKDEIITAEIVCEGRLPNEKIAVAKERTISIPNCPKEKGKVRLKITRTKHNIFIGFPI